jgi:23S rRNA G2069 N7-methylase RlmK/C1962 C5-methylase RlmI
MDAARALNWAGMGGAQRTLVKVDEQMRAVQLARENMRLLEENERLRHENADLAASAEIWIRLYEAALARAKQPSPIFGGFHPAATRQ